MGVEADMPGRLSNIERLPPFPIHILYYITYWTQHKFVGQCSTSEKVQEDMGGNPSLAWPKFLTKALFRYIMACGEEKHKWH